ncbi:unnamed protein product [Cylicostephanus goldi]|uniref:Uncharacterized protein n=1 Tax=Cylicostephanus goldi TaxID=71465 RepID=A0A3P7MIU2_CYLGO|nr:unnamed protein product [Cylicostephanus goldi]
MTPRDLALGHLDPFTARKDLFCVKIGIEEPPHGPSSFSQLWHSASGHKENISSSSQINVWNDMRKNIRDYVTGKIC